MVTNYYNASNNFSAPIKREPKPFRPAPQKEVQPETTAVLKPAPIDQDTLLLAGLLLFLLMSDCKDTLLILVLLYLMFF